MPMIGKAQIKNPQVNGGEYINLNGVNLNETQEVYTSVRPKPNSHTQTYNERLPTGKNSGLKERNITIQGNYELGTTHQTGNDALIDYEHLLELVKRADQKITLK